VNNYFSNKNSTFNQSNTTAGDCTSSPIRRSFSSVESGPIRIEVARHRAACHRRKQALAIDGLVPDRLVELSEHPLTQQLPHTRRRRHDF
jgi:hypothetical protein